MLERNIEKYLTDTVKKKGGWAVKLVSPSASGLPDRLVLMPGGICFFVELKSTGAKMRPIQVKRAEQLRDLGFDVFCIDSKEAINTMFNT